MEADAGNVHEEHAELTEGESASQRKVHIWNHQEMRKMNKAFHKIFRYERLDVYKFVAK